MISPISGIVNGLESIFKPKKTVLFWSTIQPEPPQETEDADFEVVQPIALPEPENKTTNMKEYTNLEIIQLKMKDDKVFAVIAYQDTREADLFPNYGNNHVEIPVNLRDLQVSIRGNVLVDQSVKHEGQSENKI